jgi:hypothetical protein
MAPPVVEEEEEKSEKLKVKRGRLSKRGEEGEMENEKWKTKNDEPKRWEPLRKTKTKS